ncbi:20S proteasome beta 5 subunit, partial [Tribonema minus]
ETRSSSSTSASKQVLFRFRGGGSEDQNHQLDVPGASPLLLAHGTTTVAMVIDGGIIAAVDSRASMGAFIGSSTTTKFIPISKTIVGTMAGGAADCSFWLRVLGEQVRVLTGNGARVTVRAAARVLANVLHGLSGGGLSIGTMIMGWDGGAEGGSPDLYYVDSEGTRVRGSYFAVGSGSTYAYGVLDAGYQRNMTVGAAAALAARAVQRAAFRDAYSGGFINVYHVNATGVTQLSRAYDESVLS